MEELKDLFWTHPSEFEHSTRTVQLDDDDGEMNKEQDDDDDDGDDTENAAALHEAHNSSHSSRRTGRISTTQTEVWEELMFQTYTDQWQPYF